MNIRKVLVKIFHIMHIALLILMVGLGLLSLFRSDLVMIAIDWIGNKIVLLGNWNYLILFVTAMAESFPFVGAVLPGMNIMILVGGFFITKNWDIFPLAALLAMLGACVGNAAGYFMGRFVGQEVLAKYGVWFGAGPRELAWLEKQIHKNGFWFIVGGKFHNLLRSFIPYLAGSHHMSGRKFWLANIFGSSIWSILILLIGIFAVNSYEVILKRLNYVIIAVVIISIVVYFVRQKNPKKRSQDKALE